MMRKTSASLACQLPKEYHMRTDFLEEIHSVDHGILLYGDFNEELGTSMNGMTKLCSDFGLVDIMRRVVGGDNFKTYNRGKRQLDYILCDQWIAKTLEAACYEPFYFRTKGDHRAIILDFNKIKLFGNETYELARPIDRQFEDHLEMESTSRGLQQWLATNKPVILVSFQRAKQSGQHQNKSITSFFKQYKQHEEKSLRRFNNRNIMDLASGIGRARWSTLA